MKTDCRYISYKETGMFSSLIEDYLADESFLSTYYGSRPDMEGLRKAVEARKLFNTNRTLIHQAFSGAYTGTAISAAQQQNIDLLLDENTFTVVTAHQPNIFSGYLYFIYKTAHTIALARELSASISNCHFVPVFYIGSEDNDLDELSKFNINGKSFRWHTRQTGAVGRMKVDQEVIGLIDQIEKELTHLPFGAPLIEMLRRSYVPGNDMATSTFLLLNELFREEGLLVLQPDNPELKSSFRSVMRDDLLNHTPQKIVESTNAGLSDKYKIQVNPRAINLFYLHHGVRNRIDRRGDQFVVEETAFRFTEAQVLEELEMHPENFSPNVILRGLYQETILPNVAFVGGGSELAYWMELKGVFEHYHVPYPVLVLRNSFLLMDAHQGYKMHELGIDDKDLFKDETKLANELVQQWAGSEFSLTETEKKSKELFSELKKKTGDIDKTLVQHVHALEVFHLKKLETLEKKMLKAERKKQAVQLQRIWKLKSMLFPNGNLQERVDNFMPYFAQYGPELIKAILAHSAALKQEFAIMEINN